MRRVARLVVPLLVVVAAIPAQSAAGSARADGPRVKTGPVRLSSFGAGDCPASSLRATVRLSTLVLGPTQTLEVTAGVRDVGSAPCPYTGSGSGSSQTLGPCGVLSIAVFGRDGREVWPGRLAFSCPLLVERRLGPGASLRASGDWSPRFSASGRPGPGVYRVVVGGRLSFGVTLR